MHLLDLNVSKIKFLLPSEISGGNKFSKKNAPLLTETLFSRQHLLPVEISVANKNLIFGN